MNCDKMDRDQKDCDDGDDLMSNEAGLAGRGGWGRLIPKNGV